MFKLCLPGKLTYAERIAAIQEERSKQAETAVKNGLRDMIGRRETPVDADKKRLPYAERTAAIQAERAKQAETAAKNGLRETEKRANPNRRETENARTRIVAKRKTREHVSTRDEKTTRAFGAHAPREAAH